MHACLTNAFVGFLGHLTTLGDLNCDLLLSVDGRKQFMYLTFPLKPLVRF